MMDWIRRELDQFIESKPPLQYLMNTFDSFHEVENFFTVRGNYLLEYEEFRDVFKVFYKKQLQ